MPGLYPAPIIVERSLASVSTQTLFPPFIVPSDLEILGLLMLLGTAPGSSDTLTVNVSDSPTSQLASVSAYNLWTSVNVPSVYNTAKSNFAATAATLIQNRPYAQNYPFPGPSGTTAYVTAQSTAQTTDSPVTSPPTATKYGISGLVAPDNTYTDLNGLILPASIVHAGDVLSFVVGGTAGAAANLEIVLFAQLR